MIKTTRDALRNALGSITSASTTKSSIAILDGVKVERTKGGARLSCTDTYLAAASDIECSGDFDPFVVVAETFRKIVSSMPDGDLTMKTADGKLTIKCGGVTSRLPTRSAEDFPHIATSTDSTGVVIAAGALRRLFGSTRHSAVPSTPARDGAMLAAAGGKAMVTVCGGKSLARRWEACGGGTVEGHIPPAAVAMFMRALSEMEDEAEVTVAVDGTRMFVGNMSAQLYSDPPAPGDQLLAQITTDGSFIANREALIAAVKRVAITADDRSCVQLRFRQDESEIDVASESINGETVTVLKGSAPKSESVLIASDLLLAQLEQLPEDDVEVHLSSLSKPAPLLFKSANYIGIAMPMVR